MTNQADLARTIAMVAHAGQTEKGGLPYFEHVRRVAHIAWEPGNPDYQAVAFLHDVLEDTAVSASILAACGISTANIASIEVLTRRPDEPYGDYVDRVAVSCDPVAIAVKRADLADHIARSDTLPESLRPRYEHAAAVLAGTPGG